MYVTFNIFEALIAIFFLTSFFYSFFNFLKLGVDGNPVERCKIIVKWRDHLVYAIVNLIIYIILKGNIFVFSACIPFGYAIAFTIDEYVGHWDSYSIFKNSTTFNIIYSILNTILIVVAFMFR